MTAWTTPIQLRALGEKRFDAEHEDFAMLVVGLAEAGDADVAPALSRLHAHAFQHFEAEDIELHVLGGTANECHLDEHKSVLASMREVECLVATGNFEIARALARKLAEWLPHHVEEMDLRLTQALFTMRTGGAQVQIRRPARLLDPA
jgi:hemerythrin